MEIDISSINLSDINPNTSQKEEGVSSKSEFELYPGDIFQIEDDSFQIEIDGLSPDKYIQKITEEMNKICIDSIPFDKWDYIIAFSLALLEVAGDFFIGDPAFKHSLANKNGPLVNWMKQFHKHDSGSPLDYQGEGFGGGSHRGMTLGHDSLPLARLLYGAKANENDSSGVKTGKKIYNNILLIRDILNAGLAIYSISSGQFIDFTFTKDNVFKVVIESTNQNGTPYETCNVFVAFIKWLKHLLADFCSSSSLPVPGFSLLTHWPDRDVEAFAIKLYKNGMNLRTMALQGIPVAFTEIMMRLYVHCRYSDASEYSEEQIAHKLNRLLLLSHGITTAVNVGKVVITKNPARLNLPLIMRTANLVWKVLEEELRMTNNALLKEQMGAVKNRVESIQTLILLDKTIYEMEQYNQLIQNIREKTRRLHEREKSAQKEFGTKLEDTLSQRK